MNQSFIVAAKSLIGLRKKSNQDRILIKIGEYHGNEFGLFVMADGMGGLEWGERAAEVTIQKYIDWWTHRLPHLIQETGTICMQTINTELGDMIYQLNDDIIRIGQASGKSLGTTASVLFLCDDQFIIKHVGDSRIYKIDDRFHQLTTDHSWVADQVRQGQMTELEASRHPKRNVLTECLGVKPGVALYSNHGNYDSSDVFILCSDGFYNLLTPEELTSVVASEEHMPEFENKLEEQMALVYERGAHDNASAILVAVVD